jgi:hypothetical protein
MSIWLSSYTAIQEQVSGCEWNRKQAGRRVARTDVFVVLELAVGGVAVLDAAAHRNRHFGPTGQGQVEPRSPTDGAG